MHAQERTPHAIGLGVPTPTATLAGVGVGTVRDVVEVGLGALLGILAMVGLTIAVFYHRYRVLARTEFELSPPPVPRAVLQAVKEAEARSYAAAPWHRRIAEYLQDVVAFVMPSLAYRFDFSVGKYRVKSSTIERTSAWAMEQGYLLMHSDVDGQLPRLLSYFSEQPVTNDWQVAVILEYLRRDHPGLAALTWEELAADPMLVAKLYSGYMGAGGDWQGWRATMTPGPVALERMQLDAPGTAIG